MSKIIPTTNLDKSKVLEQIILVHVKLTHTTSDLTEFVELAVSTEAEIVNIFKVKKLKLCPRTFIGSGKVLEISALVKNSTVGLVIFNCQLTPSQERNLEKILQCRVLDRTGLILDIFAQRAKTYEGKLQVELAQLQHMSTRLIRGWTHLERQKGGIGLRGPGETQLETDRRLLRERIKQINKLLLKVSKQRIQSRSARIRSSIPIISLVGYTNAGKSTLFNVLSKADIYTADRLFATLDPTTRRVSLPMGKKAIISDTVGFIQDLPHELIKAFKSTLEEIRESSLLLHVVNVNWENKNKIIDEVDKVLEIIGATHVPQIIVFNQIDKQEIEPSYTLVGGVIKVWISAKNMAGIDILKQIILQQLYGEPVFRIIRLISAQSKIRASLYARGVVVSEHINELGEYMITVKMSKVDFCSLENELTEKNILSK